MILATLVLVATAAAGGLWYMRQNSDQRAFGLAAQAEVWAQQGRTDLAIEALRRAIAIRDDVPQFHMQLGRIYVQNEDLIRAFRSYNLASSLAPSNVEALAAVAQIGVQVGELDTATEATRTLLLINPSLPEGLLVRGIIEMTHRDYSEAIEYADRILAANPRHQEAVILKIRVLMLREDEDEARALIEEYRELFAESPAFAMTELEVSRELENAQGMLEALEVLRKALPERTELLIDEASVRQKLGEERRAVTMIADLAADPEVGGEELGAAVRWLRLYASNEDLVAVVPRVRRTGGEDARIDIARLLMQRGLVEAAVDLMDGIQGVDQAVFSASVALERGRTAQALSQAEAVLREDDAHCYSRYVESRALNDLGRHRDAVYSAQLATNECPTLLEGWVALAEAYNDLELDTQSDRAFTEGLDANPQEPWLAEQYAAWLAANGRDRKAVAVERKLTRAMPGYTPAWNAYLARCQSLSASCQSVAREGRAASLTIYGVDPPPGERAAGGLFGRFLIR